MLCQFVRRSPVASCFEAASTFLSQSNAASVLGFRGLNWLGALRKEEEKKEKEIASGRGNKWRAILQPRLEIRRRRSGLYSVYAFFIDDMIGYLYMETCETEYLIKQENLGIKGVSVMHQRPPTKSPCSYRGTFKNFPL